MKQSKQWLVTIFLLLLLATGAEAQKSKTQKPAKKTSTQKTKSQPPVKKPAAAKSKVESPKTEAKKSEGIPPNASEDEKKVRDIVAFLQFVLNTLGSSNTPARDKEVLITESYNKIFRDAKVQVEDDLDEEREVITNKDVVAYLKDVDFFFSDAKFEFTIESIQPGVTPGGQHFYKVALTRNLTGTTAEGSPVNNTIPRFIEVNHNPQDQDLKIASIYTNEFDEREALTNWWKELSFEWQAIFKKKLNLADSVQLSDIKNITTIEELDLSHNKYIQTIEPLAQLLNLKLLNLSHTTVTDLIPIRNLTELVELNLSFTKITDLSPLKYSNKLTRLNIAHTEVIDVSVLEKMQELQNLEAGTTKITDFGPIANLGKLLHLNLKHTKLTDLSVVSNLVALADLNVSRTLISDLSPVKGLKELSTLIADSTQIKDLTPISSLEKLKALHANQTLISDLQPLQKLPLLEKIYCDQTLITREKADAFMASNPRVLVIFDSKDLKQWWETLSPEWKQVLSTTAKVSAEPSKEELAIVTNLDSLNFKTNISIVDLEPLRKVMKLRVLVAGKTGITDLTPLSNHREIKFLDISETGVTDLSIVNLFSKLNVFLADQSKIQNIEPLYGLKNLKKVYADLTTIHDITAREFLEMNPDCLLIYKTNHLNRWWRNLSSNWKEVFRKQMGSDTTSTRENLHRLVELETFHFNDAPVTYLSELSEFVRLKELHFSGTAISAIPPLESIRSLRSLHATNSPIQRIESLAQFKDLEDLDISNTPVDDLKPLEGLKKLRQFNCAGTQIKKLDPLENLGALEILDCSNTKVTSLKPIEHLPLKTLKCYNARVSAKDVENFKDANPDCSVIYYR